MYIFQYKVSISGVFADHKRRGFFKIVVQKVFFIGGKPPGLRWDNLSTRDLGVAFESKTIHVKQREIEKRSSRALSSAERKRTVYSS